MDARYFMLQDGRLQETSSGDVPPHLGAGVFETFLVTCNGEGRFQTAGFSDHLRRLHAGADLLEIGLCSDDTLRTLLREAAGKMSPKSGDAFKVRLIFSEAKRALTIERSHRAQPAAAISLMSFHGERSLPEIKSCSALLSWHSARAARKCGFDEALLIDSSGIMRECSWSNIFWFDGDGRLFTSASKILPGVTRGKVMQLSDCSAKDVSFVEFKNQVSEAFITSSIRGVVPVKRIDDKIFPEHEAGKRTGKISSALQALPGEII